MHVGRLRLVRHNLKGLTEEKPIDCVQKTGNFKPRQNPAKNGAAQRPHRQQPRKDPSQSYKFQKCGYTHEKTNVLLSERNVETVQS